VLHQHLCGRSPHSADPSWMWGESPFFPRYADRLAWSAGKAALTAAECAAIVQQTVAVLREAYGDTEAEHMEGAVCGVCAYPMPAVDRVDGLCPACRTGRRR